MVGGLQQPWSEEAKERETDSHESILEDHRGYDDSGDGDEEEEDIFKDALEDYEVDKKTRCKIHKDFT